MPHIVILSPELLFREALSDIISRELGVVVTSMEHPKSLNNLGAEQVDLLITTQAVPKWEGRILHCRAGEPKRIRALLSEVAAQLADKHSPLMLTDHVALHEKNKKLERTDTGTSIDLTEKEQGLLLFIKAEGEASREEILKNVWGIAEGVTTHTLDTHMYRLRQKWREVAQDDCIVATDKGYRWYDHG